MLKFNSVACEYADWFNNTHHSFLEALKTVQVTAQTLVPGEIHTMQDFMKTIHVAKKLATIGQHIRNLDKLERFLTFWTTFGELKDELDAKVLTDVNMYCGSITRLRVPAVKERIDEISLHINGCHSEKFDFKDINNNKDNLYTYKLTVQDRPFMGLVAYIPYLLKCSSKICYLVGKLYLEAE